MPKQTVTRAIETEKASADILDVLKKPTNLPKWAPVFADAIEHVSAARYRVTKGEESFTVELLIHESAGCVDYLREMNDGKRGGAYIRVMPRPAGGSTISMSVPVAPTATEDEVAKAVVNELDALVHLI